MPQAPLAYGFGAKAVRTVRLLPASTAAAQNPDGIDFAANFKISSFPQIRPRPEK
jgi:hypothetical protein